MTARELSAGLLHIQFVRLSLGAELLQSGAQVLQQLRVDLAGFLRTELDASHAGTSSLPVLIVYSYRFSRGYSCMFRYSSSAAVSILSYHQRHSFRTAASAAGTKGAAAAGGLRFGFIQAADIRTMPAAFCY